MISEGYVTNGATVYISSRDEKALEKAVNELNALGKGKAYAIPANFYKEEDCQKLVEELKKRESSTSAPLLRCRLQENRLTRLLPPCRTPCPRQQLRIQLGCAL